MVPQGRLLRRKGASQATLKSLEITVRRSCRMSGSKRRQLSIAVRQSGGRPGIAQGLRELAGQSAKGDKIVAARLTLLQRHTGRYADEDALVRALATNKRLRKEFDELVG